MKRGYSLLTQCLLTSGFSIFYQALLMLAKKRLAKKHPKARPGERLLFQQLDPTRGLFTNSCHVVEGRWGCLALRKLQFRNPAFCSWCSLMWDTSLFKLNFFVSEVFSLRCSQCLFILSLSFFHRLSPPLFFIGILCQKITSCHQIPFLPFFFGYRTLILFQVAMSPAKTTPFASLFCS